MRPVRRRALVILAVALAAAGPWIGWLPVIVIVAGMGALVASDRLVTRARRPENVMFATWVGAEAALAAAVAVAGSAGAPALSLLSVPILTLTSRFSMRGVLAGVGVALALTVAVALGFESQAVLAAPETVIAPVAVILCVAVLSAPLMRSDIEHRTDAVVDQLTGMLNRKALDARVHELTMQSRVTHEPVGIIVADLDHFKAINDTGGHNAGDRALQAVATRIRSQLRAFDLAYRLGGEEFLILVPGSDLDQTTLLAERVRDGVCSRQLGDGLRVTMSLGVTASGAGLPVRLQRPLRRGRRRSLQGQALGRNRVCTAAEAAPETRTPAIA